jgi:hypothetical protein
VASGPTVYHITDELWDAYSQEQLALQVERLKSTGRYRLPSSFTVRLLFETVVDMGKFRARNPDYVERANGLNSYFEFRFVADKLVGIDQLMHYHRPSKSAEYKLRMLELYTDPSNIRQPELTDIGAIAAWWEGDDVYSRLPLLPTTDDFKLLSEISSVHARDMLACLLYDRSVRRVESEPRNQPMRQRQLFNLNAEQSVQKITMYVPRRVSTAANGGTHASPHMHFRAEHTRQQPYGPRKSPSYREIVIAGKWINAADIDPSELGTPGRTVTLRGM